MLVAWETKRISVCWMFVKTSTAKVYCFVTGEHITAARERFYIVFSTTKRLSFLSWVSQRLIHFHTLAWISVCFSWENWVEFVASIQNFPCHLFAFDHAARSQNPIYTEPRILAQQTFCASTILRAVGDLSRIRYQKCFGFLNTGRSLNKGIQMRLHCM